MAEDDPPLPPPPPPPLIPFLPDEVSILCIARVPVTSHTAIAQVSRSWRSFVRSLSFFSVRSELAVTEHVLTVSIGNEDNGRHRWYHLHPYQTPTPIPLPQEHDLDEAFPCVSLGPHLFSIGRNSSQNSLRIYDGCLRRWSQGPPMSTLPMYDTAGVVGGRICVSASGNIPPYAPLAMSLDPAGTRWDSVPPIPAHLVGEKRYSSHVLDGKLFVYWKEDGQPIGAVFDPDTVEWAHAPQWWMELWLMNNFALLLGWVAVVGGVPYVLHNHILEYKILGYGNDGQWWPVAGESVVELFNHMCTRSRMTLLTFGGLLCLVGSERQRKDGFIVAIFAGIDIRRTADRGFSGSIVWLDSLLKHSKLEEEYIEEYIDQCVVLEL